MSDWITAPAADLEAAIAEFKRQLPGWWFSVAECSVSCDASCGPDRTGPDKEMLWTGPNDRLFDNGFHADLSQPSTLAQALQDVMAQALEAKRLNSDGWRYVEPGVRSGAGVTLTVQEPMWVKA